MALGYLWNSAASTIQRLQLAFIELPKISKYILRVCFPNSHMSNLNSGLTSLQQIIVTEEWLLTNELNLVGTVYTLELTTMAPHNTQVIIPLTS